MIVMKIDCVPVQVARENEYNPVVDYLDKVYTTELPAYIDRLASTYLRPEEKDLPNFVYTPTLNLVNYVKSLNVPVICFPREIKNYKEFCEIVKPDAVNIDYNISPKEIVQNIKIPVQGGLDPKILLTDKETLKKETIKYLEIFKDHPYIFNLGYGVLPETNPEMVEYLVNTVKDFK